MHYKDGQEVKLGDRCTFRHFGYDRQTGQNVETEVQGIVAQLFPQAETCNVSVVFPFLAGGGSGDSLGYISLQSYTVTSKESALVARA